MTDRLAYLEALGIPAFVPRRAPEPAVAAAEPSTPAAPESEEASPRVRDTAPGDAHAGVILGSGKGSCLFLAGTEADESSALASDLARTLATSPVWARLADGGEGQRLELAIAERLFTHVVVFGEAAARLVFGASIPETCGPARVTVVDDFPRLATDAGARKSCWLAMKAAGVVSLP